MGQEVFCIQERTVLFWMDYLFNPDGDSNFLQAAVKNCLPHH